jgi:3D (Asp-Asp-Asp) domain-containing protein
VTQDISVRVVRVMEDSISRSESIPFQTVWRADGQLELDQQRTEQPGRAGVRKQSMLIVYEDGVEVARNIEDEWVERPPATRIVRYGTNIVVRELQTPDGPVRYWRRVRMLATSYHASGVGKTPDHPDFGITRLGWKATTGIVAVDPKVVRLRTSVYVPGYGFGVAADTGGKIKGRWIDLCYDEEDYVSWKTWVDVYLIEPVPPPNEIVWMLPNYPTERR